jgi:hypothetical protein
VRNIQMTALSRLLQLPSVRDAGDFDVTLHETGGLSVEGLALDVLALMGPRAAPAPLASLEVRLKARSPLLSSALALGAPPSNPWASPREVPLTLTRLVKAVETVLSREIHIHETPSCDGKIVSALACDGRRARVYYAAHLDLGWKRFLVAKGLAHLLLTPTAPRRASPARVLGCAAAGADPQAAVGRSEAGRWLQGQFCDELVALHLLFAPEYRPAVAALISDGAVSLADAANHLGLPAMLLHRIQMLPVSTVDLAESLLQGATTPADPGGGALLGTQRTL